MKKREEIKRLSKNGCFPGCLDSKIIQGQTNANQRREVTQKFRCITNICSFSAGFVSLKLLEGNFDVYFKKAVGTSGFLLLKCSKLIFNAMLVCKTLFAILYLFC